MEKIKLFERIKENSVTVGDGNIVLNGAADGFSAFGDYYSYNDVVYYAITDGTRYEVGSGQYVLDASNKAIVRFPFQSTNGNNKVSFPDASPKEVFATYPGKYSVFTAPDLGQLSSPQHSGIAFWATENILDYDSSVTWDKVDKRLNVEGEANVSGNVTVGGNVVVSGTMDIQGDVTFIDSSNVTIWDKQLELASMSGTAQFGDGNIDDAGIVVKSTDTDKKWVWKNSTDAWTTDENIVTSLKVQAKSGILDAVLLEDEVPSPTTNTLYNDAGQLMFNGSQIGTWNISDGKGGTEEVLQGQYVHVSGMSGIDTFYNSSTNVLEVNPGVLSGYLTTKIATSITFTRWDLYGQTGEDLEITDLKSVGIVGLSGIDTYSNPDNFQIEINAGSLSGWAAYDIDQLYTSGNAVSGWTRGTITQEINSLVGGAPATLNTLGELATAVNNEYNFHTLIRNEIGDSGNAISGWAAYDIDQLYTSGNAVSGWARTYVDNEVDASGNAISGWAAYDIDQLYTSGNAVSGWAAYDIDQLYTSGNAVSGWSKAYTDANGGAAASGWAEYHIFDLYTSGMAISGWARTYADAISSAAGMTNWNVSDGAGSSESITEGETVEWVGRSGIDTYYNSTNNELEINAGGLSGWAAYDIDKLYASGNAVSGWAKGYVDGKNHDVDASGNAISGWAAYDIDQLYTSGNAISGWAAGSFGAGGGTVSEVANGSDDRVATFSSADALNGEANLTFDGSALGLVGTFTVGVDDTGHDVKFHGATAGSYLEWDESEDRLHLVGGAYVNQPVPSTGTATEDATVTLDLSLGNYFNVLLGADVTAVEFTNATIGQRFIVRFVQVVGAIDGYDISWSTVRINGSVTAELKWAGGITPTMTGKDDQTHRGHKDVYGFLCTATGGSNGDTKFDGFIIGQDIPD